MLKLFSPRIPGSAEDAQLCFAFWYATFGAGDIAVMKVNKVDNIGLDEPGETVVTHMQSSLLQGWVLIVVHAIYSSIVMEFGGEEYG